MSMMNSKSTILALIQPDYLLEFQDSPQASQDEEDQLGNEDYDEQWEEITSEEVERDVSFFTIESPQSQNHSSLLLIKWICTFICFWQAMCCLPDSAVEWLLKFLKAVFELIGQQSTFMSALAAALPSSLYLLWRFLKIDRDNFVKYAVCPSCNLLYDIKD